MNYHETRKYIDKLKYERDCAEHTRSQIRQRGNDKSNEAQEFTGSVDRAGIINRLMKHRNEE